MELHCTESVNLYGGVYRCRGRLSQDVIYSSHSSILWRVFLLPTLSNLQIPEQHMCLKAAWKSLPWWIFRCTWGNAQVAPCGFPFLMAIDVKCMAYIKFLIKEWPYQTQSTECLEKKKSKHYNTCNNSNCIEQPFKKKTKKKTIKHTWWSGDATNEIESTGKCSLKLLTECGT